MRATPTDVSGVILLEPVVYGDDRGFFMESFNARTFADVTGLDVSFVQDNHSRSRRGVLRGIHYQLPHAQGKLVRTVQGAVWDVAVDLRSSSETFGESFGTELSEENRLQLWIPEGFGHGFLTLTESADVVYKTTTHYVPQDDQTLAWDDPELGIEWPIDSPPVLSPKDLAAPSLRDAPLFR